jgi:voltage-gated potassium channel
MRGPGERRRRDRRRPERRIDAEARADAATNRENVAKLRRAGANTVISPASIVGHLLVTTALGGEADADIDIDALTRDLSGGKDGDGA